MGPVGRLAAASGPSERSDFVPSRIEIVNCHDYAKRFEQAYDEGECRAFIRAVTNSLPASAQQCLLPLREQERRNSRALVFMPFFRVKPGLSMEARQTLIEHIRSQLDSGAHDRHERRPRARWEPGPHQRPLSKLLALGHRLSERVHGSFPEYSTWKVQASGKSSVEVWLTRPLHRPILLARIDESLSLAYVVDEIGPLTADGIRDLWAQVNS